MFIGLTSFLYWGFANIHRIDHPKEKSRKLLRHNQKLPTSADFNCSCNLSAMRAMNSEFVGFPFVLLTVYPKNRCKVSRSPRSHATSMAWRMALSTRLGVVWNVLATCGYRTFVMALAGLQPARGVLRTAAKQEIFRSSLLLSLLVNAPMLHRACSTITVNPNIKVKFETNKHLKKVFSE